MNVQAAIQRLRATVKLQRGNIVTIDFRAAKDDLDQDYLEDWMESLVDHHFDHSDTFIIEKIKGQTALVQGIGDHAKALSTHGVRFTVPIMYLDLARR